MPCLRFLVIVWNMALSGIKVKLWLMMASLPVNIISDLLYSKCRVLHFAHFPDVAPSFEYVSHICIRFLLLHTLLSFLLARERGVLKACLQPWQMYTSDDAALISIQEALRYRDWFQTLLCKIYVKSMLHSNWIDNKEQKQSLIILLLLHIYKDCNMSCVCVCALIT